MEQKEVFKTDLELEEKANEILKILNGYSTIDAEFILKSLEGLIRKSSKVSLIS